MKSEIIPSQLRSGARVTNSASSATIIYTGVNANIAKCKIIIDVCNQLCKYDVEIINDVNMTQMQINSVAIKRRNHVLRTIKA